MKQLTAQEIKTYEVFFENYSIILQAKDVFEALKLVPVAKPILAIMDVKFRDAEYSQSGDNGASA